MTRIHEGTPAGLEAIHEAFGDRVEIMIHDLRDRTNPRAYDMMAGLEEWKEELARGSTEQRLYDQLNRLRGAGRGSEDFDRQARGRPIEGSQQRMAPPAIGGREGTGREPRGAAEDRGAWLLAPDDNGSYRGPIVATDAGYVTQLVDGAHIVHKRMVLTGETGELTQGKDVAIDYRGGIGKVRDPEEQTRSRSR